MDGLGSAATDAGRTINRTHILKCCSSILYHAVEILNKHESTRLPLSVPSCHVSTETTLQVERMCLNTQNITRADFPLPTLGPVLENFLYEVKDGRGFQIIRGFPVQRYSRLQTMVAYWGLGLYLGKAVPQNKKGHLIGHIKVSFISGSSCTAKCLSRAISSGKTGNAPT